MDVPPQESVSIPHFLKVYLGEKEFRSIGKESFSFPVKSLRENLIIALCDVEGKLVAKTELRAILIAEKGATEVVFPLGSEKDVELRLKFILSEEEKEKIREMRNLALKQKHEELLKSTHETFSPGSSSVQETKDYTKRILKRLTETDQTRIKEQKSLTMVKQDPPIDEEHKPLTMVKEADKTIEEHKPLTLVKEAGNTMLKHKTLSMVKLEGNTIEEHKPLTVVKEAGNTIEMHKSLTMVKQGNIIEENKSLTMVKEESKSENLSGGNKRKSKERSSSGTIRKMISVIETNSKQKPGPHIGLRTTKGQISKIPAQNSLKSISCENEDIKRERRVSQTLSRRSFSGGDLSEAVLQNDPNFAQIPLINETIMLISNEKEDSTPDFTQRPLFNDQIMFISNEKEDLPPDFEQRAKFNEKIMRVSNLNDENGRREIREAHEIRCFRNCEKSNKDYSNYSFQIFDTHMPRHLCITTGPKQLRNMIDSFNVKLPSDEKQKLDGVEAKEENKEIEIKNRAHHNFGSSILNGRLIDKGARILIVIIACGTIIRNTR